MIGDVLDALATLPDESVHCVITSPPYWGLRDYGTAVWQDGDPNCDHRLRQDPQIENSTLGGGKANIGHKQEGYKRVCQRCGAVRTDQQIGLEETPGEYVDRLVRVFREVRRVLRQDGVCWVNLGDSYTSGMRSAYDDDRHKYKTARVHSMRPPTPNGLAPKNLIGIPWRVAFALQADGWCLRAENIWEKPNKMPESVKDRTTRNHEQVFMLTKSGSAQFWTHPRRRGTRQRPKPDYVWTHKRTGLTIDYPPVSARLLREFWVRCNLFEGHDYYYDAEAVKEPLAEGSDVAYRNRIRKGKQYDVKEPYRKNFPTGFDETGKNRRSVWHINTAPYRGAHFATFPPGLVRICLLAGSPARACPVCGAPWVRHVRSEIVPQYETRHGGYHARGTADGMADLSQSWKPGCKVTETLGWMPSCDCLGKDGSASGLVLDPFGGAGTVSIVAEQEGRDSIYIDLKPEYGQMAADRLMDGCGKIPGIEVRTILHDDIASYTRQGRSHV